MKRLLAIILTVFILIFTSFRSATIESKKENRRGAMTLCGALFAEFEDTTYLPIQLHKGLGDLHYPITSLNPRAQEFFDQGLRLIYAFNHVEALRSFREANRIEPECAMAYWGQALALGPNINDWNPQDRERMAFEAITKAKKLARKFNPKEKDLIEALATRYNGKPYPVRDSLNNTYRLAMKDLATRYPNDPEILTQYADAIMTSMPWDYWNSDGSPRSLTIDARKALENVLKAFPKHPGAHHMYVHLIEASKNPGDARSSAVFLETAMPSAGHIVHMPSHIYARLGEYERSNISNDLAVKADEVFLSETEDQGLYRMGYYPHNIDFLVYGGMMTGQSSLALYNGIKVVGQLKGVEKTMPAMYDFFTATNLQAMVRFGKWNEILTLPQPDSTLYHSAAMSHFARGLAFLRKDKLFEANREAGKLERLVKLDTLNKVYAFYNSAQQIFLVANYILQGEILLKKNKTKEGLASLQLAADAEDVLRYNEPPDWRLPARHFFGAALVESGDYAAAEKIFQADLKNNPDNGWALQGLMQSQIKGKKNAEAAVTLKQFMKVWKKSDVIISSSRF